MNLKRLFLASAAALAMVVSFFAAPANDEKALRKPAKKPSLSESFNRAAASAVAVEEAAESADIGSSPVLASATPFSGAALPETRGTKAQKRRLARIMAMAVKTGAGRALFDRIDLSEYGICFLRGMGRTSIAKNNCADGIVVLNPDFPDDILAAAFVHEASHIEQEAAGMLAAGNPSLGDIFLITSVREAISYAHETHAVWELAREHPGLWERHAELADRKLTRAWEDGIGKDAGRPDVARGLAAVFDAYFESSLCPLYEGKVLRKITDPDLMPREKLLELAAETAVSAQALARMLAEQGIDVSMLDLGSAKYRGCGTSTLVALGKIRGMKAEMLPPLRNAAGEARKATLLPDDPGPALNR